MTQKRKSRPIYITLSHTCFRTIQMYYVHASEVEDGIALPATPNSPDLNVLDLGLFRAIQSVQYRASCYNVDQLIDAVNEAFDNMPTDTLNRVFLTLQSVMELIMKYDGCNRYKLPHMNKDKLSLSGPLPVSISCTSDLHHAALRFLGRRYSHKPICIHISFLICSNNKKTLEVFCAPIKKRRGSNSQNTNSSTTSS